MQERVQRSSKKSKADEELEDINLHGYESEIGVEDLLAEIDSVLEENAEAFVQNYVQRNGQ